MKILESKLITHKECESKNGFNAKHCISNGVSWLEIFALKHCGPASSFAYKQQGCWVQLQHDLAGLKITIKFLKVLIYMRHDKWGKITV